MAGFYDQMQGIATGLLQQFAQGTVTHIKLTPGAGPANRPGPSVETPTVIPGATVQGVPKKYVDQGLAVAGDLLIVTQVVAGLTVAMADQFEVNGVRYRVVQIMPIPPSGTPVVFNYIARK